VPNNTQRLDFNVEQDAWEPMVYYDGSDTPIVWHATNVRSGGSDVSDIFQADKDGNIMQADVGSLDNGLPVKVRGVTKRFYLGMVGVLQQMFVRLLSVEDTLTITITAGGSEFGQIVRAYSIDLNTPIGPVDKEIKIRLERELVGRWAQIQISGSVVNGPAVRDVLLWWLPLRMGRVKL